MPSETRASFQSGEPLNRRTAPSKMFVADAESHANPTSDDDRYTAQYNSNFVLLCVLFYHTQANFQTLQRSLATHFCRC